MYRLIWKDFMIIRRTLWFIPLYAFGMAIAFSNSSAGALSASTIGIAYMLLIQANARDEKNKSEIMLNSLPLSRQDVVLAKYLSVFPYVIMGIIFYLLTQGVVSITGIPIPLGRISLEEVIGVLVGVMGMISIYFPIYFKLGYLRSNMIATLLFLGFIFFSMALINYGLNGDYNILNELMNQLHAQADWQIAIYLLTFMVIIMSGSILLSLRFYSNREF